MNVEGLNLNIGQKALITTDNWFYAPDGRQYRGVFGTVRAVRTSEESLGVRTNAKSTNWYLEIGNMTLAGCQIHYAVRTDECFDGRVLDWMASPADGYKEYSRPSAIYFADEAKP